MTARAGHAVRSAAELAALNREFYDALWSRARLIPPQRFNTWSLVSQLADAGGARLEVAPGLRPRLPLQDTCFVDISAQAVTRLRAHGANAVVAAIDALPFTDATFDFVCAFDIIEHIDDDDGALADLSRVATRGAALLLSVPLHESAWTAFDDFVGHRRRYEPAELARKLARHGFVVESSAVYGMQPKSSRLLDLGMWYLTHQRERAMWWYNRVIMPLGLRTQQPLTMQKDWIDDRGVDTILLLCRRLR